MRSQWLLPVPRGPKMKKLCVGGVTLIHAASTTGPPLTAIPFYTLANRGLSSQVVWIRQAGATPRPADWTCAFCEFRRQPHSTNHGQSPESCLRNSQKRTKVLGRGLQSEHVNDPAGPGLRSAERGGITIFQKGGPNLVRQYCHARSLPAGRVNLSNSLP